MHKTIVITGATSGIGEATALRLAEDGQYLILAARGKAGLERVADACRRLGADVLTVPTDVSDPKAVQKLEQKAVDRFGEIDVWINNAGVIFYGRFGDITPEEFQKVLDTNLQGTIWGSRIALQRFRNQRHGTLINIASGFGALPAPFVSPYVTSKFAIRGLTASLRQELIADHLSGINVCCVLPSTVDTPVYQHAGNKMERQPQAMPLTYRPETAARIITRLIEHPKGEVVVGKPIRLANAFYALMPNTFTRLFAHYAKHFNYQQKPGVERLGNLFAPLKSGYISGHWQSVPKGPREAKQRG